VGCVWDVCVCVCVYVSVRVIQWTLRERQEFCFCLHAHCDTHVRMYVCMYVCVCVCTCMYQQQHTHTHTHTGSERVKATNSVGIRLKEATHINKSLSALGDVMKHLSERPPPGAHAHTHKQQHVPYRNSKLTFLLQDSLG